MKDSATFVIKVANYVLKITTNALNANKAMDFKVQCASNALIPTALNAIVIPVNVRNVTPATNKTRMETVWNSQLQIAIYVILMI